MTVAPNVVLNVMLTPVRVPSEVSNLLNVSSDELEMGPLFVSTDGINGIVEPVMTWNITVGVVVRLNDSVSGRVVMVSAFATAH